MLEMLIKYEKLVRGNNALPIALFLDLQVKLEVIMPKGYDPPLNHIRIIFHKIEEHEVQN